MLLALPSSSTARHLYSREMGAVPAQGRAAFDAFVDFAVVSGGVNHSARINPAFDPGDHLHSGNRGNCTMTRVVDLTALSGR